MLKSYFAIAIRSLLRNKVYSVITIVGLSIGLAACILIMLYTEHEYSFDSFHLKKDRIFTLLDQEKLKNGEQELNFSQVPASLAPLAKQYDPNIDGFVRVYKVGHPSAILQNVNNSSLKFSEDNFQFADSNFFDVFCFKLLFGNKTQALNNPFSLVISEDAAKKYFADENPIGKLLRFNNQYNFTITAVAAKVPSNSSIEFDFLASLSSLNFIRNAEQSVGQPVIEKTLLNTYFLLRDPRESGNLAKMLTDLNQAKGPDGKLLKDNLYLSKISVYPISEMHLHPDLSNQSAIKYLKIFSLVAVIILLLAIINYMSLSTARATIRSKEIGVRKVMGADRKSIAVQFFIESGIFTAVAFLIGYFIAAAIQPMFFRLLQIDVDHSFLYSPGMIVSLIGLFFITFLMAACYPALFLSSFNPVEVLYGKMSRNIGAQHVRRIFTVIQFTIAVVLIISVIVIEKQMYFIRHNDSELLRDNIVMIPFSNSVGKHFAAFKKEAQAIAAVDQVATSQYLMFKGLADFSILNKTTNQYITIPVLTVDENFISMLGLKWKIPPIDSEYYRQASVIINEAAIEKLNLGKHPLNESIDFGTKIPVAGVLKDFNFQSMDNKIDALGIFTFKARDTGITVWDHDGGCLYAKIKPHTNLPMALKALEKVFSKYESERPFEYRFMDDTFEEMYEVENRLAKLSITFVIISIVIASLGLLGLSTFMAAQRRKEIGIRKVLGSAVVSIVILISKDFLKLVLMGILLAVPIAWWLMHNWLQDFAYQVNIEWWIFVAAGFIAIVIAMLTMGYHSIMAAIANPVKSLRTE